MASIIVHLAITDKVAKELGIKDLDRLRFGAIIPDCPEKKNQSHLKISVDEYDMFDLETFRKMFREKMLGDPLYLGYYLHLVEDSLYRVFLYERNGFNPRLPGNKESLYHDYKILNNYVVGKYGLTKDMIKTYDIGEEPINSLESFDISRGISEVEQSFVKVEDDGLEVFTKEMLDEYMSEAEALCLEEARRLDKEDMCIKNSTYRWKKPVAIVK